MGVCPWAARLFGDPLLTAPLRVIAADVALRAGMVEPGWLLLNGAGRHRLQASLMAAHSLCRCVAVAGNLWLAKAMTSDAEAVGVYAAAMHLGYGMGYLAGWIGAVVSTRRAVAAD